MSNIQEFITKYVRETLQDGLDDYNFDGVSFGVIREVLEEMGYELSDDSEVLDEVMYTNGWEFDYHQYIFKNGEYTGYSLYGSLYYGTHRIRKYEVNRE